MAQGHTPIKVTLDVGGHRSTVQFDIERPDGKSIDIAERTPEELFLLAESIRTVFISENELVHDLVKKCAAASKESR